jgi:transposase
VQPDWRDERIAELEAELVKKDTRSAELERQVEALTKQVADLLGRQAQNSSNSQRPPSSDSPEQRRQRRNKDKKKKAQATRKRGGQPGHQGAHRELVSTEKVSKFVDLFPSECENCWKPLPQVADSSAKRYQLTEVPPIEPHTTEWRRHAVTCRCCGYRTRAAYDETQIPASPFGPRLMAIMALLTGVYHLGRRRAVDLLSDIVGVRVSLGALSTVEGRVSDAVQSAVAEAWTRVEQAPIKHTDGTTWYQASVMMALWTIATTAATVFKILPSGTKQTLEPLFGALKGILVSDRATTLTFWAMERRQICWAHLLRKFVSFSERDGPAHAIGLQLLDYTGIIFQYFHDYKSGKLSRTAFVAWMAPIRHQVEALLAQAVALGIEQLSGSCRDMLQHKAALWTFVDNDGVEPTNNHAEREIRAFVLWRKRSFGSQSARGNLFAENLMTVAHTARKQKKNVLAFLVDCCRARLSGSSSPSLFGSNTALAA